MTQTAKPNFLFFITDQHRADHLGCYGNPIVKTQNILRSTAEGRASRSLMVRSVAQRRVSNHGQE